MVIRREAYLEVEELDVGPHEMNEDSMAVKVEYPTDVNGVRKGVVVRLCI